MVTLQSSKPNRTYNFGLMGASLDSGNMGVRALAASTIQIIQKLRPHSRISLFIGCRTDKPQKLVSNWKSYDIPVMNYRLTPKAQIQKQFFIILLLSVLWRVFPFKIFRNFILRINPWLNEIKSLDCLFEIRGGDSFSDIYGFWKFLIGSLRLFIPILVKQPFILLPQTYGPFKSKLSEIIAKFILMRSDAIFSRDKDSIKIIENLLGPNIFKNKTIHFSPDVAFSLQSEKVDEPSIIPSLPSDFPVVGINVNGLMYNGGYSQDNMFGLKLDYKMFIFGIIQEFLKIENLQILLVPHTFGPSGNINSDPDACKDALLKFSNHNFSSRIHMVNRQYNQSEIKYIIGLCQFFIGSRMHSCIAGLSQGIPTIGVAYSKKFRGVFNSIGVDELVIDARNETTDNAIKKTIAIFHDSDRFISHLHQNVSSAIDNTYKSIDSIISRQPYSLQHTAY